MQVTRKIKTEVAILNCKHLKDVQEIGHVSAFDLFGFDVKGHVDGRLHGVDVFGQIVSEYVVGPTRLQAGSSAA